MGELIKMKKSKIYSITLLILLLLPMFSTLSQAAATPNYVGIEENDTFIFEVMYDEGVYKDLMEDAGEDQGIPEAVLEQLIDDNLDMDEDIIGIKIVILDVDDEEKTLFDPQGDEGVRVIYNFYEMEEDSEWNLESEDETWAVWKYDEDVYEWLWRGGFDWHEKYDETIDEDKIEKLSSHNAWFVSTKIDWSGFKKGFEDHYEDHRDYDESKIRVYDDQNRFEVSYDDDEDDDFEELGQIFDYDDNGVLQYHEQTYDGDPYVIVERQYNAQRRFVMDNLLWIVLGAIGVVVVIVVIVVVIKRKKK